jgi:hypothetical protein
VRRKEIFPPTERVLAQIFLATNLKVPLIVKFEEVTKWPVEMGSLHDVQEGHFRATVVWEG